jgi:hypothetical protein
MATLIGTASNQIPTNGDLGTMAFQDSAAISVGIISASGNLTVLGSSNLGSVGNLVITGGSATYVLSTNGSGVLSWASPVAITANMVATTTNATFYPMLANVATGNSGHFSSATLAVNPSTGLLSVAGSVNAASYTANISVAAASTTGAFNYGVLSYSDTNIMSQYTSNVNTYTQMILQNTSAGSGASADFVVSSNTGNSASYYGNFGINSSTFTGTGALNLPNATYLYSNGGDLVLGTSTANSIHMVVNSGATDAMLISTSNISVYSNIVLSGTSIGLVSASNINAFSNVAISGTGNGLFFPDGTFMTTLGTTLGQIVSLQQNMAMP